jgi:hypothetical protein
MWRRAVDLAAALTLDLKPGMLDTQNLEMVVQLVDRWGGLGTGGEVWGPAQAMPCVIVEAINRLECAVGCNVQIHSAPNYMEL